MKIIILFILITVCHATNAQTTPCGKIERVLVGKKGGQLYITDEHNDKAKKGFAVNSEPHKFGMFYGTLKPYIWCTQEAMPEFKRAAMFARLKTGCILAGFATSYFLGSVESGTGKTALEPLVLTSALFIGSIPLYVFQRKHIRKSIERHNSTLNK